MALPEWLNPATYPDAVAVGVGLLGLLYKAWRMLKSDQRKDRSDDMEERIRTQLEAETKSLRERIEKLNGELSEARAAVADNRALIKRQKELLAEITRLRELVGPHGHDD